MKLNYKHLKQKDLQIYNQQEDLSKERKKVKKEQSWLILLIEKKKPLQIKKLKIELILMRNIQVV